jgi:hypothetical protein
LSAPDLFRMHWKSTQPLKSWLFGDVLKPGPPFDGFSVSTAIKVLTLISCGLGVDDVVELSRALQVNAGVEKLVLGGNEFGDEGDCALIESLLLENSTIKELTLERCGILSVVAAVNAPLERLFLRGNNNIGNDGAVSFAQGLAKNESLIRLKLFNCRIAEKGAAALGEAFKINKDLVELDVGGNAELVKNGGMLTTYRVKLQKSRK